MCLSPNLLQLRRFAIVTPIAERLRDQYYCSFCPEYRLATYYCDRLTSRYILHSLHACDACADGWLEISSQKNPLVV